jgi:hypothetical protein
MVRSALAKAAGVNDWDPVLAASNSDTPLFEMFSEIDPENESEIIQFLTFYEKAVRPYVCAAGGGFGVSRIESAKAEIELMRAMVALWNAVQDKEVEAVKQVFSWYSDVSSSEGPSVSLFSEIERKYTLLQMPDDSLFRPIAQFPGTDPIDLTAEEWLICGRILAARMVSNRLSYFPVAPQVRFNDAQELYTKMRPSSLISAVWLQFFQYMTQLDGEIVRCARCKRYGAFAIPAWGKGYSQGTTKY